MSISSTRFGVQHQLQTCTERGRERLVINSIDVRGFIPAAPNLAITGVDHFSLARAEPSSMIFTQ